MRPLKIFLTILFIFISEFSLFAKVYYYSQYKDSFSLENLISSTTTGDTIYLDTGVYKTNLKINKNISIIGIDSNVVVIDGQNKSSVIQCYSDLMLNIC